RTLPDDADRRAGSAAADEGGHEVPAHHAAVSRRARRAGRGRAAGWIGRVGGGAEADVARGRSRRNGRDGARASPGAAGRDRRNLAAADRQQDVLSDGAEDRARADRAGGGGSECCAMTWELRRLARTWRERRARCPRSQAPCANWKRAAARRMTTPCALPAK